MNLPQKLTPFSKSILQSAMISSLQRTAAQTEAGRPANIRTVMLEPDGINALLAEMTSAVWGTSADELALLLNTRAPAAGRRGKAARGIKLGQQVLGDFSQAYGRLRRWSEWVFASEWSQAQLLQVMEEVEPMVSQALMWMHLSAITAVGSYAHLGELISKFEKDPAAARALRLGLTSGLETPDGSLISQLEVGITPEKLRENFGHMALGSPCEIASPRIAEMAEALIGDTAPPEALTWDLSRAQGRQEDALKYAHAKAGFLSRSGLKKVILLTQAALITHAKARDALAYVLAAARHWARAAADEGMSDGRIHAPEEIYLLEIEEIKQMMTGEWHSRDHVEPLIAQRQQAYEQTIENSRTDARPLGVAGSKVQGMLQKLQAADDLPTPAGFIALARDWRPARWRALLMAEGVIDVEGDLLSWVASVARMGDLPALVGGAAYADWPVGAPILLDPAKNRAEQVS